VADVEGVGSPAGRGQGGVAGLDGGDEVVHHRRHIFRQLEEEKGEER